MLDKTNPHAPQHDQELQESLRTERQKLPLLVWPAKDGRYVLTDGHRRWRAMLALEWTEALCIVTETMPDDKAALHTQLILALQHEPHHNRDVAAAVKILQGEFGMKVDEIAARLSKGRAWINRLLQLCDLPETVLASLAGRC